MAGLSLRRTRLNSAIRGLVREVRVHPEQFIQPHFAVDALAERESVAGMPGVFRETPDSLLGQIESDLRSGASKLLLFGVPGEKNDRVFDHQFTVQQIGAIKRAFGDDVWLAVDVCLCSHTSHGHCGVLNEAGDQVDNDSSVQALAAAALEFAGAGADCVAPSDMMDGRVAAIRRALDEQQLDGVAIMSYASKFRSAFYGPFREAAESTPRSSNSRLMDRASYQIDPGRPTDALQAARRDADEGADILMVKPGLPYLDVLARLSDEISKPWAVYQTSGEYAALELLAEQGLADRVALHNEAWSAMIRAGASMVISYAARHARGWLG